MASMVSWTRSVNAIMKADYAVSLDDVGLDASDIRRYCQSEPEPDQFVRWFARKYGLTSAAEIGVNSANT